MSNLQNVKESKIQLLTEQEFESSTSQNEKINTLQGYSLDHSPMKTLNGDKPLNSNRKNDKLMIDVNDNINDFSMNIGTKFNSNSTNEKYPLKAKSEVQIQNSNSLKFQSVMSEDNKLIKNNTDLNSGEIPDDYVYDNPKKSFQLQISNPQNFQQFQSSLNDSNLINPQLIQQDVSSDQYQYIQSVVETKNNMLIQSPTKGEQPMEESQDLNFSYQGEDPYKKKKYKRRYNLDFFTERKRVGLPTLLNKNRDNQLISVKNVNLVLKEQRNSLQADMMISSVVSNDNRPYNTNVELLNQLDTIEKQLQFKKKMEKFTLLFNQKPQDGIKFLINEKIIEDNPDEIAEMLLISEGLSKDLLGKFFGNQNQYNQNIFISLCNLLDFENLHFDDALRLLLSRFKLPGEAQQIDRIMEAFAKIYHRDNPTIFSDVDTTYVMAYSLIMLHTDAHSHKIEQKRKMTKEQFVKNNIRICPSVTNQFLEDIYDRITKTQFNTQADYIESMYGRIYNSNLDLQGQSMKNMMAMAKQLEKGHSFLKYGRYGKPQQRIVNISVSTNEGEEKLQWQKEDDTNHPRFIYIKDIIDVMMGYQTTSVMRRNKIPKEFDSLCFSIVTKKRSLDLKAETQNVRAVYVNYFKTTLMKRRQTLLSKPSINQINQYSYRENISDIWKTEIFPKWEQHWDYNLHQPKNTQIFRLKNDKKLKLNKNFFYSLFCLDTNKNNQDSQIIQKSQQIDINQILKNKDLLLCQLWHQGIPSWVRKTLWPIIISNQLEVSKVLYDKLLYQVEIYLRQNQMRDKDLRSSLKRKDNDLNKMEIDKFTNDPILFKKKLNNIIDAFVFYRQDIGYIHGMENLGAHFLQFLDEYESFQCMINLMHQWHFLSFFRGDMREIEWRVRFFDEHFKKKINGLYQHFKALDLSTEIFLLPWFLSLYTGVLNLNIASRIWDSFLLDGEIYAIKTGIGLLKYYELELKMSTFEDAVSLLKKFPDNINEIFIFNLIDETDISYDEYQEYLLKQKMAAINVQIHTGLFYMP